MLRAIGVTFGYDAARPVLMDVSADFEPGSLTVIAGPNGAGKTTLLRLLLGLRRPDQGGVELVGPGGTARDVAGLGRLERAARLAYIPQRPDIAFAYTVRQVVEMGLFASGAAATWAGTAAASGGGSSVGVGRRSVVDRAMARTDVLSMADRPVGDLSVGQQQRVAAARALAQSESAAHVPAGERVFLADEPVSALDPRHAIDAMELLRGLSRGGVAVVVVLHDLALTSVYADRVLLLDGRGSVAAAGPAGDVLREETLRKVFDVEFERTERGVILPKMRAGSV